MLDGCNRVGLAYRNLDVIIPWTLSDYLDMNAGQKRWFNDTLQQHLAWHCTTQLPGYLDWLDRLQQMVDNHQVSDNALQSRTDEAKQAVSEIARAITPSAVHLLRGLDDQQVKDMNDALAKDLRKRQDEYLKPPLPRQIQARAERMSKRLDAWIGPLSASQQQRVVAWSAELGDQNQQWIDNRARWQAQFIDAVQQRHAPDFAQKMQQLLVDRERAWTPEYRQADAQTGNSRAQPDRGSNGAKQRTTTPEIDAQNRGRAQRFQGAQMPQRRRRLERGSQHRAHRPFRQSPPWTPRRRTSPVPAHPPAHRAPDAGERGPVSSCRSTPAIGLLVASG